MRAGRAVAQLGNPESPDFPDVSRDHASSAPQPNGDTSPSPVTTIRRMMMLVLFIRRIPITRRGNADRRRELHPGTSGYAGNPICLRRLLSNMRSDVAKVLTDEQRERYRRLLTPTAPVRVP